MEFKVPVRQFSTVVSTRLEKGKVEEMSAKLDSHIVMELICAEARKHRSCPSETMRMPGCPIFTANVLLSNSS